MNNLFLTGWILLSFEKNTAPNVRTSVISYDTHDHTIIIRDHTAYNGIAKIFPSKKSGCDRRCFTYEVEKDDSAHTLSEKEVWIFDPNIIWKKTPLSKNDLDNPPLFVPNQVVRYVTRELSGGGSRFETSRNLVHINIEKAALIIPRFDSANGMASIRLPMPKKDYKEEWENDRVHLRVLNAEPSSTGLYRIGLKILARKGPVIHKKEEVMLIDPRDACSRKILSNKDFLTWICDTLDDARNECAFVPRKSKT